jgi:DNA-binding NarL/FixJ family response regulator
VLSPTAGSAAPVTPVARPARARLVIADDHDLARAGLRSILAGDPRIEVVGEAANGREALAVCRRLRPDALLMDVRMPELDGLAATRALKQELPQLEVILITMHENPDYLLEALRVGASGYVLKGADRQTIVGTVRRVLRGEATLSPDIALPLLRQMAGLESPAQPAHARLSARELDVLRLLAHGYTNGQLARELHLSVSTVKAHVEHILRKLDVTDRTQAAVRAYQSGILVEDKRS